MKRFLGFILRRSQFGRRHGIVLALFFIIILGTGVGWFGGQDTPQSLVQAQVACLNPVGEECPNGQGFLWTDTFGWISLNCVNDWDSNLETAPTSQCTGPGGSYGLIVSVDAVLAGELRGYGWSPNLGLICFGETCGLRPDSSVAAANFNLNRENLRRVETVTPDGQTITRDVAFIQGFARVETQRNQSEDNQGGWIALNGTARGGAPVELGAWITEAGTLRIAGSAWQQNPDLTGVGWIFFGDPPPGNANCAVGRDCDTSRACDPPRPDCRAITPNPTTEIICDNSVDDDHDPSYATATDDNPLSGVDCLDYDCEGRRFYSTTYPIVRDPGVDYTDPVNDYLHCGPVPTAGNFENILHPEDCFDGHDNDLDGARDCDDPDCATAEFSGQRCAVMEFEENTNNGCYDNFDNDGDGLTDCADDQCNNADGYVLCPVRAPVCLCDGHERAVGLGLAPCSDAEDPDHDDVRTLGTDGRACDNCSTDANPEQEDTDADGIKRSPTDTLGGDVCDPIAWLQTRGGAIYARTISGTPPPPGQGGIRYTATYCILTSGGTVHFSFRSQTCDRGSTPPPTVAEFRLQQYSDTVALLSDIARSALRTRLDIAGLKAWRYGKVETLSTLSGSVTAAEIAEPEREIRVYYHSGDLTINGNVTFENGEGRDKPGARVILVENGKLTINGNLSYAPVISGTDLKDLASLAFIVLGGDVEINPGVTQLVGTYLTTGTLRTGGGQNPLDIDGLLVARQFNFGRQLASLERGAERITYDGRAALNPPPGLADFLKTLPEFRSVAPR